MNHPARVLPNKVVGNFERAGRASLGVVLSISPQPVTPASVEILTNTQEFFRTKDSILVTLMLSFGPTAAALLRSHVNMASRPNNAAGLILSQERRFSCIVETPLKLY
jgi:hypothetical protein